jgi:hypothetical protein
VSEYHPEPFMKFGESSIRLDQHGTSSIGTIRCA